MKGDPTPLKGKVSALSIPLLSASWRMLSRTSAVFGVEELENRGRGRPAGEIRDEM
jgi:hypothetical protein